MSVVVAIKEGKKIYMGADSQSTKGNTRITLRNPNNFKIWKVIDSNNTLMASVGAARDANVIRLVPGIVDEYDEFAKRVNYKFVVRYIVPNLVRELKKAGFIKDENYIEFINSAFLFAYKDKLFLIDRDLCVLEINDYVAIGSGSPEAIGSLLSTEGEDPKTRIIKAIKASAANDIYVDYPIILSDTETTKFDIVTKDSEANFTKPRKKKSEESGDE